MQEQRQEIRIEDDHPGLTSAQLFQEIQGVFDFLEVALNRTHILNGFLKRRIV